jgi:ferritin-like protein
MSSENLHVPREKLSQEARMLHYALTSLQEELDAVDWYRQRADDTDDEELKQILLHNMREEMEHASMVLEWIRRNNEDFAGHLRTYLFTEASIIAVEKAAEDGGSPTEAPAPGGGRGPKGFTVGPLKGK